MEELQQSSVILSVPPQVWKEIFRLCYTSTDKIYLKNIKDEIFNWFVALKITSKKLNLLLDDRFFFNAIIWTSPAVPGLNSVFTRKKIQYFMKNAPSYDQVKPFLNLEEEYANDYTPYERKEKILALIAQYRDPDFLASFAQDTKQTILSPRAVAIALRHANERETSDMTIALLSHLNVLCGVSFYDVESVSKELLNGKKFHFENVVGFDNVFASSRYLPMSFLTTLLDESIKKQHTMIIPNGELLRMKSLGSKQSFYKGLNNFWVEDKKADQCTIHYRKRFEGHGREISVAKETNEHGITYTYAGVTRDNLYELIVKSSLADQVFSTYPHTYVALTKESVELPLDQQPWFIGLVDDNERTLLQADAQNSLSFFTYSTKEGKILLQRTHAGKSSQRPEYDKVIDLSKKNLSQLINEGKISFGVSNYRHQEQVHHYFVRKYVEEQDLESLKKYVADNGTLNQLKCGLISSVELPKLSTYPTDFVSKCMTEPINEELLAYLLQKRARLDIKYDSRTVNTIASTCSERTIGLMLDVITEATSELLAKLIYRGASYNLVKRCFAMADQKNSFLFSTLCEAFETKKSTYEDYTKRILVTLAWQFGNEDNYFKLLPKELIDKILNYEDIDEPPYSNDILLPIAKNFSEDIDITRGCSAEPMLKFFWKHWGTRYTSRTAMILAKNISGANFTQDNTSLVFYWFRRIFTSPKLRSPLTTIDGYSASNLTLYCLKSSTTEALYMLEFLLKNRLTSKEALLTVGRYGPEKYQLIPAVWLAVTHKNLNAIRLLIDHDMLADSVEPNLKLSEIYALDPTMSEVAKYITQCRQSCKYDHDNS